MLNYLKNIFYNKKHYSALSNFYFNENISVKSRADSYISNVIVNRCVNIISQSASHVPWVVIESSGGIKKKNPQHPANRLLKIPNPSKAGAEFFAEIIANKLLFGNSYILGITPPNSSTLQELHSLHPNQMEIVINNGTAIGYKYGISKEQKIYTIDCVTRKSQVLHLKSYNPSGSIYGVSCLEAAGRLIDLHNKATEWNHTLLKNGARPSGAFIVSGGNYLSDEQFKRLQQDLQEKYYGSSNAGRPMLLEGGLDWREMSISPKDMDFIESKNCAAREIALAFGVPPQLLGISGDNTYSNMQEARLALWEETLMPLLDKIADELGNWLSNMFRQDIIIDFDRDSISALTERREKLWMSLNNVNFLSVNEKRLFLGLSPIQNGDQLTNTKV